MTAPANDHLYNLQMLVLERHGEPNMARFYVLRIETTLFGDVGLVREWGRLGTWGKRRLELHPDSVTARESLDSWLSRKLHRGYKLRLAAEVSCPARSSGEPHQEP